MCLTACRVRRLSQWNWDGERIIHDCIVPSSRPPIGKQRGNYDIDVREFLITERNAVMRRTLEQDLRDFIKTLPGADWKLFRSRESGAFDHRAHIIAEFVATRIAYQPTNGRDPWQFPDETLALNYGDCEDRALLIASLLLASGVSSFNVRVALGKFRMWFGDRHDDVDHVWVMYKDEAGKWQVIEPAIARKVKDGKGARKTLPQASEYIPYYLFNDVHLWEMQHPSVYQGKNAVTLKRNWSRLKPEFAGWVHKSILNDALIPSVCPSWVLRALNLNFTSVLGRKRWTVDVVDLPSSYDPREHFDNGYIDDGWQLVAKRLREFKSSRIMNLESFHRAAHSIADFYAHSSYGHFAPVAGDAFTVYDPSVGLAVSPDYSAGTSFDLTSGAFTTNKKLWTGSSSDILARWQGQIISGRYAQPKDSHDTFEAITFIPDKLLKQSSFKDRGALPHHNEIAVDEDTAKGEHRLYKAQAYQDQYRRRYNTAVLHIRKSFADNW